MTSTGAGTTTVGRELDRLATEIGGPFAPPARQVARDLIAAVLDVPRFWPTGHADRELSELEQAAIEAAARRLAQGMPLAYAVRRAPYRSLSLYVDERVLIPRPETEMLVDFVLEATRGGSGTAIDVGTGSGCIALALATEGKFARVVATDVSPDALDVARENHGALVRAQSIGANAAPLPAVEFRQGSFLEPVVGDTATVVVSNPPYISLNERNELPELVRAWEPALALFADDDGMAAIRAIVGQASTVLEPGGLLALEVDSRRAGRALELVQAAGYRDGIVRPDLTGRARYVLARHVEE